MKKIFIIHRWDGSPNEPMYVWLKNSLEKKGFEVFVPKMPDPEYPKIDSLVGKLKELVNNPNKEIFFIGHSIGCQTILRYVENLPNNIKIGGMVLIAPWFNLKGIEEEEGSEEIIKP